MFTKTISHKISAALHFPSPSPAPTLNHQHPHSCAHGELINNYRITCSEVFTDEITDKQDSKQNFYP